MGARCSDPRTRFRCRGSGPMPPAPITFVSLLDLSSSRILTTPLGRSPPLALALFDMLALRILAAVAATITLAVAQTTAVPACALTCVLQVLPTSPVSIAITIPSVRVADPRRPSVRVCDQLDVSPRPAFVEAA